MNRSLPQQAKTKTLKMVSASDEVFAQNSATHHLHKKEITLNQYDKWYKKKEKRRESERIRLVQRLDHMLKSQL